jgi:hypothetical protein
MIDRTAGLLVRSAVTVFALLLAAPLGAQEAPGYGVAQSGYDTDGHSVDSIAVFFEPLARYGRWLDTRYGRAWSPNVGRDWRPYTIGHWEQGRFGLTWRSDEPFGWAVFHFGRWVFDQAIGWLWLPDTDWGPGWVAWRDGDDIAGWAPLPPAALYGGYAVTDWGYDQWYAPAWVYVPRTYLYSRSLRGVYLPYARNREFWEHSRGADRDNPRDHPRDDPRDIRHDNFRDSRDNRDNRDQRRDSDAARAVPTYSGHPAPPFGARDGFVPGPAHGFDHHRPGVPPNAAPPVPAFARPAAPAIPLTPPPPRPAIPFAPPPGRPPMPAPMPAPQAAPRPAPPPARANEHERPR